jgi:hypothetical protein
MQKKKWEDMTDKEKKQAKIIGAVLALFFLWFIIFQPDKKPPKEVPQQQAQVQEDKNFMLAAHHLLKEKVSEDASINMLDFSEHKIPDKDRIDTQGTFDLNGKTVKFWATFEYSTEKPLRLKVADKVVFDEK